MTTRRTTVTWALAGVVLAAGLGGARTGHPQGVDGQGDDSGPVPGTARPDATAARPSAGARGAAAAGNSLDLGTTSITGNQELPKVLYIVPWKRSDLADLVGRPVNTLLDEVLAPIDPDVFERHLDYYGLLYREGEAAAAAPDDAETEEE